MSRRADFIASLCFFFIGLFFVIASRQLAANVIGGAVTPSTFPNVFGLLMIFLSVLLLLETYKAKAKAAPDDSEERRFYRRFFIILGSMLVYILLIEPLGFVISTFLFLMVSFQAMHRGDIAKSFMIAGGFAVVLYFVFIKLLEASVQAWPSFLN